ncbi:hypothetical protein J502_2955 [Acinetobacter sp. 1294596]|uniref:hypothetical protein n=1 Tax=Acinetobacter sp. 1294596 TaxID=1310603 RepID=UPI00044C39D5|nr:hypothetical protein [Acinetobacter sp. 1294596]EXF55547.1 hypothetical protein J502_3375 [Acinetobacter sp. 1294596]EXF55948.1 hypothetical protein J502_2955 [Acinetobacter sp. 1294596]
MPQTVKLNAWEQEALEERFNLINKKLIMKGFKPLKSESEIVHKILEMTLNKVGITENGSLKIEE